MNNPHFSALAFIILLTKSMVYSQISTITPDTVFQGQAIDIEVTAENIDRIVTTEMRGGSRGDRGIIIPLYEKAREKLNGKPISGKFFEIAKDWIISSDNDHKKTAIEIVKKVRANIKNSNKKYFQYFTFYLKKNWCANKQKNAVKSAAKLILKKP